MNIPFEVSDVVQKFAVWIIPLVLAITLHEAAHGFAALRFGDDTAQRQGRISANPLHHVDPFGTLLLPAILLLSGAQIMFGWAKPVPVSAWKFANPRRGMMIVAAAGPAMNFFLAWLAGLSVHAIEYMPDHSAQIAFEFIDNFILMNLVLALFNLLPIPPLDGGRIMVGLLPAAAAKRWAGLERYGIVIVLLLMFIVPEMSRDFGHRIDPVRDLLDDILPRARNLVLVLSGNGIDD